jgi:SAM-dependent methyltransferase
MNFSEINQTNKEAWEKTAVVHRKIKMEELLKKFMNEPGFSLLDKIESKILIKKVQIRNKDVIQLCCNNARELLSIKNLGAKRCVGIDITEGFINQGRELALAAKQELELHSMDVYNIPESFHNSFDVVYITIGAICWISDLNKFMKIISKLLRKNGLMFMYEMHPILQMFETQKENPIVPKYSYFKNDPFIEEEGYDYYDKEAKIESRTYSFQHTLEEIFMTSIKNKLQIQEYKEYPHDISNVFMMYEQYCFPMCFTLLSKKVE